MCVRHTHVHSLIPTKLVYPHTQKNALENHLCLWMIINYYMLRSQLFIFLVAFNNYSNIYEPLTHNTWIKMQQNVGDREKIKLWTSLWWSLCVCSWVIRIFSYFYCKHFCAILYSCKYFPCPSCKYVWFSFLFFFLFWILLKMCSILAFCYLKFCIWSINSINGNRTLLLRKLYLLYKHATGWRCIAR